MMRRDDVGSCEDGYEVVIVGCGPAGVSTWLYLDKCAPELARRTLVIDKALFPRDKLCGGAVGGWSESVLKDLDVRIEVPSLDVSTLECCFDEDVVCLRGSDFRVVSRKEFDEGLLRVALDRGLHCRLGECFQGFERTGEGLVVCTDQRRYRCKVLVGADGSLSRVRRAMRVASALRLAPALELFLPVDKEVDVEFFEKRMVLDFSPVGMGLDGYVWHFPCFREGRSCMNHGIVDFRVSSGDSQVVMKKCFEGLMQKRYGEEVLCNLQGHPIRCLSDGDVISQPHVLLTGDAAGIESATGGGIHLALSYGRVTAREVVDAFGRDDFLFGAYQENVMSDIVGRWICKCNRIGKRMYEGEMYPLDAAEEIFRVKK